MNRVRRTIVGAVGLVLCSPWLARAQRRPSYIELNPPLPVEAPDNKIEVLEFFWYGCIHCYNLEPKIEAWLKTLPKDVEFRRVPAIFNQRWGHDAAIFFTFEALGVLEKLHRPFFDAIHVNRLQTDDPKALNPWLEKHGVDLKKFEATARSFGVQSRTKRAARLTADYKIDGTPAMAVHGRYTVPSSDAMLEIVNQLVGAIRKNKS